MTGSARNCGLIHDDFGRRQLNDNTAITCLKSCFFSAEKNCRLIWFPFSVVGKGKGSLVLSVGPGADPGVQTVSPQMIFKLFARR